MALWSSASSRTLQVIVLSLIAILLFTTYPLHREEEARVDTPGLPPVAAQLTPTPTTAKPRWPKPPNQRILGLVFYGRRKRVELLNCYLERNLVDQGGWLDEIHFIRNTKDVDDLAFLESLVGANPRYKILDLPDEDDGFLRYALSWETMERDAVYIKVDDDVVWIADDTIPRMVTRKLANPNYLLVSSNNINSPLMSKVHYDNGAYRPYLPVHSSLPSEIYAQFELAHQAGETKWEFTHYPNWTGPADYKLVHDEPTDGLSPVWLRMTEDEDILRTPIRNVTYDTWGPGVKSWSIAAQSHLSLLENLYFNNVSAYYNGLNEVWFTDYDRLSINLICVDANEILAQLPVDKDVVDEEWITVTLPKRLKKHIAIETRALAAHFSFSFQNAIEYTDVLDRYADYASKNACLLPDQYNVSIFDDDKVEAHSRHRSYHERLHTDD